MTYPVMHTISRQSWLDIDEQIVQYYIEELIVLKEEYRYKSEFSPPFSGEKYKVQKFIHFTFDRKNNYFEHIDGSFRVFEKEKYLKFFSNLDRTGEVYPQHIDGIERYKLFEVKGELRK